MKVCRIGGAALLLLSMLVLPVSANIDGSSGGAELPQPSVDLQPGDVVRIVIDALSRNDEPYADAGIETTFYFAAPSNRVVTGPLDRFTRMVKGPVYGIMVNHASSEFSEVVTVDDKAYQMVRLTSADGRATVFAFRLGKQLDGEFKDMWMTEAVWPIAEGGGAEQSF